MVFWRRNGNRRCPRCGRRSFVYKCTVCGKKRCTSCGEWFYFYVLRKGDKSSVVKTEAFCSRNCEKGFLEPYTSKFDEEHGESANALLKDNRRAVEEWFSSQMGYPGYDVWSEEFERFFKRPQFEEALESVLSGKTRFAEFETLQEAIDLASALFDRACKRWWYEQVHIARGGDLFPGDHHRGSYFLFIDENWRNEARA
jgi:hypothetical protein